MAEEKRCPECGAPLTADAPQGLCPACLLKRGIATGGSASAPSQGARTEYVPPTPAELARYFPDLEILELVGRGGMGAVYKARQKRLDRFVALKVLPFSVSRDPAFAERFAREARALARLTHPNIVTVHDFGQTDGLYYFVMEFVDGLNLRQLLNSGKISPKEALAIVPQICDALQYAHDKGIVHRDIKPENILLAKDGTVKIADFGLAKLVGLEAKDLTITDKHDVMGTPHYMAPEQVEHPQDVDHRADIYSLGVVFYQMLTGELPLGRFAPPSRKVQIDVRLDEVVLRALEKEPEQRYQHASEVKTQIETIITTPASASKGATTDRIQRLTKAPAIAVLVFGIFNWVAIPIILAILGFAITNEVRAGRPIGGGLPLLMTVPIILLVLNSLMIYGALKMKRLENFGWAIAAGALCLVVGVLAMRLMFGLSLLGLPLGLWALVVLWRCEVRETFRGRRMQPTSRRVITLATVIFIGAAAILASLGVYYFHPIKPDYIKSDYIGQAWFPKSDLIEITSVVRTADRMSVRGRYYLVSHDTALLALYITSTNSAGPEEARQRMEISKGAGYFDLVHTHLVPGLPHVSMYSGGKPFAALYFGTKEEALEESKASWITNRPPASAQTGSPTFGPVIEKVLPAASGRSDELLDLDTGRWATSTNFGTNDRETHAWIRENHLDVLGVVERGQIAVLCFDMAVVPTSSKRWDAIAPSEVVTNWGLNQQEPKPITGISPVTDNTDTWLFRTREGGIGALQIVGENSDPRGVKIRYKLVQDATRTAPVASAATNGALSFGPVVEREVNRLVSDFPETTNLSTPESACAAWQRASSSKDAQSISRLSWVKIDPTEEEAWFRNEEAHDADGLAIYLKALAESRIVAVQTWRDDLANVITFLPFPPGKGRHPYSARSFGRIGGEWKNLGENRLPSLEAARADFEGRKEAIWKQFQDAKIRYKLMQGGVGKSTDRPVVAPATLAEPPQLRFLAWQDEWKTNQPGAARHPDGSPVTDATELEWLQHVVAGGMDVSSWHLSPEPRFLKLWFSHPLFDLGSLSEVTLLDDQNNVIPLGARGTMSGAAEDGNERNGNLGWQVKTLSPGAGTNLPQRVIVRLRYTVGPLEKTYDVPVIPKHSISMTLKDGSQLNGVGQNVDGKAFVAIAVNARKPQSWRFGVVAVTTDGRELTTSPSESGVTDGTGVCVESFAFDISLANVSKFIIGTRPIRTMEWKDVVLPEN